MTEDKNKYILSINGMSKSFGRNKVLKTYQHECQTWNHYGTDG